MLRIDSACVLAASALVGVNLELRVVAMVVSDVGSPVAVNVVVGVVVLTLLWRRRLRAALVILLVRLVELGLETLVKAAVDRPRPWVPIVVAHASGSSFPSGHAAGSSVLVVSLLVLLLPRVSRSTASVLVMSSVLICLAIGASRVLLGVHYPSDVLGGLLLGTLCAVAAIPLLSVAGEVIPPRADR